MEFYVSLLDGILPGWEDPIDAPIDPAKHFYTKKKRDDIVNN